MSGGNLGISGKADTLQLTVSVGILLVGTVLSNLLQYGLCQFYMNMCCGFVCGLGDLFKGFSFRDDRPVRIALQLMMVKTACEMPALLLYAVYRFSGIMAFLPLASLALCVGLTAYLIYYLGMSQCFYLMLDFPDKSLEDIVKLSRWLMKGRRFRLFYLYMSFIPMFILGMLSCGVGMCWLLPYRETALAHFHLNLTGLAASGQIDYE
ncbi:MAG: DUF975 family protein [Lachnospiraceae bacterium]|nr:DUF975 family protein [Lachnospiraceae bacterium]